MLTTFLAGVSFYAFKEKDGAFFKAPLVFAGSYLFSITIIHILPELFSDAEEPYKIGTVLLIGFFLQFFLEHFSAGVEHGHIHSNSSSSQSIGLIISLCIHALLEGALLSHPSSSHEKHETQTILFGIILHKMPAAFALIAIMSSKYKARTIPLISLAIFSTMSPLGLILSKSMEFNSEYVTYLFALVSGSFLHISTTIFVESNPGHKTDFKKIGLILLGVLAALLVEGL